MLSAQAESLRSSLHELEDLLKEYSPLMSESTEWVMGKSIKYGAIFAEVSAAILWDQQEVNTVQFHPIAKAVFGFASVTFEVRAYDD